MEILNLIFRWVHVVAGIMWIGHLWFFNFVNSQLAKTYDADSKKKVLPELMPRALYWFRWGAAYTWITGILLFGVVYAMGGALVPSEGAMSPGAASGAVLGLWILGFLVYDQLWKSPLGKNENVAGAISFLVTVGIAFGMAQMLSGRAVYITIGGLFGTTMAANVWMRIWPGQKKIIAAVKGTGPAPDAAVVATAGLRSKHNTYMSVPLVLMMVSNHFPNLPVGGIDLGYSNMMITPVMIAVWVAIGWFFTKLLYNKSASAVTKAIGDEGSTKAA